jgi:hypothetical protein
MCSGHELKSERLKSKADHVARQNLLPNRKKKEKTNCDVVQSKNEKQQCFT